MSKLYKSSKNQMFINLQQELKLQELEDLQFKMDEKFDDHLNKFYDILGKLGSYDKTMDEEDKKARMIRTLPEQFPPIAMLAGKMSFEELTTEVQTELSRLHFVKETKAQFHVPKASTAKFGQVGM